MSERELVLVEVLCQSLRYSHEKAAGETEDEILKAKGVDPTLYFQGDRLKMQRRYAEACAKNGDVAFVAPTATTPKAKGGKEK